MQLQVDLPHLCDPFHLGWDKLSCSYLHGSKFSTKKRQQKVVLQECSGQVTSGHITAILGPSGAGKSTLLNCLMGKIVGPRVTGERYIQSPNHLATEMRGCRIAYTPQTTDYFTLFTVRETLLFASRMSNTGWTIEYHMKNIESLLHSLDMSNKINWPLNKLSGGQLKRVAVASDLITRPAVMILDEPTSGLDADSAAMLITHLKLLVSNEKLNVRPAVLLTIHTPSSEVFSLFDSVYVMSSGGYNIYQGSPGNAKEYFRSHGFNRLRGSPADSCLEVASGKFGTDRFESMASEWRSSHVQDDNNNSERIVLSASSRKPQTSFWFQVWLLTVRSLIYYSVKLPQVWVRSLSHLLVVCFFFVIISKRFAVDALCNVVPSESSNATTIANVRLSSGLANRYNEMRFTIYVGLFIILKLVFTCTMASILMVWHHLPIHNREVDNTWYSRASFFFSKFIVDSIIRLTCVSVCLFTLSFFSAASIEFWRFALVTANLFILTAVWDNIVSASLVYFIGSISLIEVAAIQMPFVMGDLMMTDSVAFRRNVTSIGLLLKKILPMNNSLAAFIISIFGFGRCDSKNDELTVSSAIAYAQTPREALGDAWTSFNVTKKQMIDQLDIFQIDDSIWSSLYDAFASIASSRPESTNRQGSYILTFFRYDDQQIAHNFLILAIWWLITSIAFWDAIRKVDRK